MHPDIKTFSDILDIDTADRLQVRLIVETHGTIHYRMRLNGHLISDPDTVYALSLFSPIKLTCTVIDACGGAVEIKQLSVNGHEILPKYQHLARAPTAWIDQTGAWEFHMVDTFYPWYHKISGQGSIA
jgi:hypothetical protein